jgi:hypothetical protein
MNPAPVRRASLIDAVRGPLMLIALGVLMAADQLDKIGFERTWPALLILFGLLKLASYAGHRSQEGVQS